MPRIAVTFSLQEVEEIERDCAVYRGRLERIAKHSAISREEQVLRRMHIVPTCDTCELILILIFLNRAFSIIAPLPVIFDKSFWSN